MFNDPRRTRHSRARLDSVCAAFGGILGIAALSSPAFGATNADRASDFSLLSIEELTRIEITSVSKSAEPLAEAPAAVYVISGDDIRRSGATSIPEALRLAPNLHVARRNAHSWSISARGFNTELANKLLVLIDGRAVYTPLYSGVYWDRQDYLLEDIDRIEVVSGPGGTLWGANAVNGVINIVTKTAAETRGTYLEAGFGSEIHGAAAIRHGGEIAPGMYYRAYGKFFKRDEQMQSDGSDAHDAWSMGQGGFRIDADLSPNDAVTLQGDYYDGREEVLTGGSSDISGYNILGRWSRARSDTSNLTVQLYYDHTFQALPVPALSLAAVPLAPAGLFKDQLDTFDLDLQYGFRFGTRHNVVWGLGYRHTHNVISDAPALAFDPDVLDLDLFTGFVQDNISLRDNLALTVGTKVEHNEYTGLEVQPSIRLAWQAFKGHTLWAAVSRAVRTPSRIDRDVRQPTPLLAPAIENVLVGNPNFETERLIAYELGHRGRIGTTLATSIAFFYNDYDDIRSANFDPVATFPVFFENNVEGETYGFEFNAVYEATQWWRLSMGYTLLQEHITVKSGRFDLNNGLNEVADPEQQVQFRSSMNVASNIEFDAALRWVDELRINNAGVATSSPDYVELDVRLAWQVNEMFEASIAGQNLLHDEHVEYDPRTTNPHPAIERAVFAKLSVRF